MRVEAYTQIQQLYKSGTTKMGTARKEKAKADQLELSSAGKDYQTAKSAVMEAPDVREELVAPLKKNIKNGTYQVNVDSFANKLMESIALGKEEMR